MAFNIEKSPGIRDALKVFRKGRESALITGRAGTGKSTLVRYMQKTAVRPLVVLAPTGVAALNVQGETIHSFFRFHPGITVEEAERRATQTTSKDLYRTVTTIVIDEISMVRADLLDCVDVFLRTVRKRSEPFGGVQMILIGDLYQLPPVVQAGDREPFRAVYETPYFFSAQVMRGGAFRFRFIELKNVYRQHDPAFIDLLSYIRDTTITDEQLGLLNTRVIVEDDEVDDTAIYLTTTNATADRINTRKLSLLPGKPVVFNARMTGSFDSKTAPADVKLHLKKGARVMFLNNDAEGQWVNGTMGVVKSVSRQEIVVQTDEEGLVSVAPFTWTLYRYVVDTKTRRLSQEIVGSFTQVPLQLAWAVTIHKSQGKTFDRAVIDFGRGTFAHGQAYVALSRCRTLEGIWLVRPVRREDVFMDWRVTRFLAGLQYELSEHRCSLEDKTEIIRDAIATTRPLHITYLKPNNQRSHRTVIPHFVGEMVYNGKSFLGMTAMCLNRGEKRVFRVDRILDIKMQ